MYVSTKKVFAACLILAAAAAASEYSNEIEFVLNRTKDLYDLSRQYMFSCCSAALPLFDNFKSAALTTTNTTELVELLNSTMQSANENFNAARDSLNLANSILIEASTKAKGKYFEYHRTEGSKAAVDSLLAEKHFSSELKESMKNLDQLYSLYAKIIKVLYETLDVVTTEVTREANAVKRIISKFEAQIGVLVRKTTSEDETKEVVLEIVEKLSDACIEYKNSYYESPEAKVFTVKTSITDEL